MSNNELSQSEIDKLLNGESTADDIAELSDEHRPKANAADLLINGEQVRPYDPTTQRRLVRERLYALEIINERFARQFRMALFNLLRRSADISVETVKIEPYSEFARNVSVPANLNLVHLKPLRGTALFVFSPNLVFVAVDSLFGGDGRFPTKVDGREFTPTEQRVIRRVLAIALKAYQEAWSIICDIDPEYIRSESQVKFTNITTSPNDIVVTTPFHIEIGALSGSFVICLPFSMIEPLREQLINPPLENSKQEDMHWRDMLSQQVQQSELELVASLTAKQIRLSKVLNLKCGDVIPIDKPEQVIASVDGVPVFSGQCGHLNGQYALYVEHTFNPIVNALKNKDPSHE